jgi:hemerythrin superfamily protein
VNVPPYEADVRVLLRADHDETLRLVSDLCDAGSAGERRAVLERLQPALLAHSRAEERAVYEPLIDRRAPDDPPLTGTEGLVDHDLVDTLLTELAQSRRAEGPEWIAAATVMKELIETHIEDEHEAMFVALGQRFSGEELRAMGSRFLAAKQRFLETGVARQRWRFAPARAAPHAAPAAVE